MADIESQFVDFWTNWWSKFPVPSQLVIAGAVRRLDVGGMMGKAMPSTEQDGTKLLEGIARDLKAVLTDKQGALFWSPAPGLVDIFYPKLLPQAADLTHSVVRSTIEHRVRDVMAASQPTDAVKKSQDAAERRVAWEVFQRLCQKQKVRADQIQTIDISELVLGMPDPNAHLSRRTWKIVDDIVDEFLENGGYCTRYPGNLVLLFFPGLSNSLARLKRRSIASDIEHSVGGLARPSKVGKETDADADDTPEPGPSRVIEPAAESNEEVARLNKAFAAMAAAPGISGLNTSELTMPETVSMRMVPVWRAGNQTLVGHTLVAHSANSASEFATLGVTLEALDLPVLAHAQADVLARTETQNPYLVIVPVHWRSLERANFRAKYLELCTRLPEELRRYIVVSMREVPEDLMAARVEECVRDLRRFCRAVMCRVELTRRNFDQFSGVSLHAVGAELAAAGAIEKHAMAEMDGFLDALEPHRTKSFIDGLHTKSLVISALASGFDYLSGSAIVVETGTLGVRSFSIPDLYEEAAADQPQNPAPV